MGSTEYSRLGQKSLSFQASSQIVRARPSPREQVQPLAFGRRKITLLIENIIEGQESLRTGQTRPALAEKSRGVDDSASPIREGAGVT